MSAEEVELLRDLGISHSKVAESLNVTRQAVTKSIESNRQYLTPDRISRILLRLETTGERELAKRFESEIRKRFPGIAREAFSNVLLGAFRDEMSEDFVPAIKARELWVFSSRPRELQSSYAQIMRDRIFNRSDPGRQFIERIVYFVPPEISRTFSALIAKTLSDISPSSNRIHILIVESSAIQIAPHFVIFDPRADPKGMVMADPEDRFVRMAPARTEFILDYLRKAGIGVHESILILEGAPLNNPSGTSTPSTCEFQVCFDSERDLSDEPRV